MTEALTSLNLMPLVMRSAELGEFLAGIVGARHSRRELYAGVESAMSSPIPLMDLMRDSVFYPASGLDGDPLRHLGSYFSSFIFADYGYQVEDVMATFNDDGWNRFAYPWKLVAKRRIIESELPLDQWHLNSAGFNEGGNRTEISRKAKPPFAVWAVFHRDVGDRHRPQLASLLFLGFEAVTAFQNLYITNSLTPACIAVIQPSDPMGSNWTDFVDPDLILAQAVLQNPVGMPQYLLYGGRGKPEWYQDPCWPVYNRLLAWPLARRQQREGALGLWKRSE